MAGVSTLRVRLALVGPSVKLARAGGSCDVGQDAYISRTKSIKV
jgi:hypothetical protein